VSGTSGAASDHGTDAAPRRRTTLRARIILVTTAVAALAVLITGGISLQLVRSGTLADARAQLSAQADLLAAGDVGAGAGTPDGTVSLAIGDAELALVSPTGNVTGAASAMVRPAVIRQLLAGESVSATRRTTSGPVLIEGRPTPSGGAVVLTIAEARIDVTVRESFRRILLALAIGLAVALLAGWLLAVWLTRPLTATATAARRLAAGDRDVALPQNPPREIADITDALGALATAITTSEGRQREFLLSISHELRTPLTALRGYGEALADGVVPASDVASVGDTLVRETERLDRFVSDLLELARLEADDFTIIMAPADAAAIARDAVAAWAGRAATLEVSIAAIVQHDAMSLVTDARRVRQVIDGLIENALRATPAGERVVVEARAMDAAVTIEVRDSGPGLRPEDRAVAFDRGALRARYRDIRPVGTGLGLSIASRLAGRLGATISAGTAPEGGASFSVSLPAGPTVGTE
jgi:two-component system, OmpR family, sensor kinase